MHTGLIKKKKKKRPFLNQRHISSLKNSSECVTERRCVLKIPPQRVWRRAFPPSSYAGARAAPVCEHEAASSSLVLRAARLRVCGPRLRPRGRGSRAPTSCTRSPRSAHRREQKAGLAHAPPLHPTWGGPRRVRPAAGNQAATTPARAPALATWCSGPAVGMPLPIPVAHQAESSPLLC